MNTAHERTRQTFPDASFTDYTYDNAEELSTALSSDSAKPQLKYGYDAGLNMVKRTNGAAAITYTVNSLNQVTSDGSSSYGYDNNGNRVSKDYVSYAYDDENQLIAAYLESASVPTSTWWRTEFTYDARGRLRKKIDCSVYSGTYTSIVETRYLYDGMRVIQERNSANTPVVSYTRGLDLGGSFERAGGIGGLLARTAHSGGSGATFAHAFFHSDGNGNVTYLINPDKSLGASYIYDPFGRTISSSGTLAAANAYRFSSKKVMGLSSLSCFGYRFYDSVVQRWVNRDPMLERGGLNLYRAFESHPTDAIDPFGESAIGKVCTLAAKQIGKVYKMGRMGMKESAEAVKAGEDVVAKSRNAAKEIAQKAGDGRPPIHEIDKKSGAPHYHPADRCGGHVFYSIAAGLTCSYWAEGHGRLAESVAAGVDVLNPLSLPQDLLDIKDAICE